MTSPITLESPAPDLFITDRLDRRPIRSADHLGEKRALQELVAKMADAPEEVLPRFVDLAMALTGGAAGGLSLLEPEPAPGVFRWRHLHGSLARFEDALTPRDHSPCGVTLDCNAPVLSLHPERYYSWISDAGIEVPEVLLVPLYIQRDRPLGTLWIVSEAEGHFHRGHARTLTELAGFLSIALRMIESDRQLKAALEGQEVLAREMSHRLKNLFAVADGMVRLSARSAKTPEEMAEVLSGRLHALASAHSLVNRNFREVGRAPRTSDLETLLHAVAAPHETAGRRRFAFKGPPTPCGDHATNAVALVVHELATNAAKYGALSDETGGVEIEWRPEGDTLILTWREHGGPRVTAPTEAEGFGSTLLRRTLTGQLGGSMSHDWAEDGLVITIRLASDRLAV